MNLYHILQLNYDVCLHYWLIPIRIFVMKKWLPIYLLSILLACQNLMADELSPEDIVPADTSLQENIVSQAQSFSHKAEEVIMNALSLLGIQYQYGGHSPETGFDCSGFVAYVFKQAANISLPHGARAMSQFGQKISPSELKPGDLVFFNTLKSAFSHVGIYLGNNKFIHAPRSGQNVRVENMNSQYWDSRFNGAVRVASEESE